MVIKGVPTLSMLPGMVLSQVAYISAHGGGQSAFVPPNAGTAPPMIASSRGPAATVPPSYFAQGASGSSGSSATGGGGAPAGAGGGGDDDDRFWWIGAGPPSRGEYMSMVHEFGADGVRSLNDGALRRVQADTTIGDPEKIVRLADVLYNKGTEIRSILTVDEEVVREEATDGVEAGIHGSLETRGNADLQLAAAIAIAFHGVVDDAHSSIVPILRRGLSYPDRRVQLKTALAMLYDGSECSAALLTSSWYNLPPVVQNRAIEMFIERDVIGRPVDGVLKLHIDLAALRTSKDSEASTEVARRLLNRERFRVMLLERPKILEMAHQSQIEALQRSYGTRGSGTAEENILRTEYSLIGAAVHVVARHSELRGDAIYDVAMDVVAHEIRTVVSPRGGPIHEADYRDRAARLIPDEDIAIAWGKLLSHEDPQVRRDADLGMIARGLKKGEI